MKHRTLILGVFTVLLFGYLNSLIIAKERLKNDGTTVLLELAPRDPRSLMQGDYMVLNYAITRAQSAAARERDQKRGRLVLRLDDNGVGRFVRFDDGSPLAEGELVLRYRRHRGMKLGAESYFFQEGMAEDFEEAKFGELKVAASGESILVGLRDAERKVLP